MHKDFGNSGWSNPGWDAAASQPRIEMAAYAEAEGVRDAGSRWLRPLLVASAALAIIFGATVAWGQDQCHDENEVVTVTRHIASVKGYTFSNKHLDAAATKDFLRHLLADVHSHPDEYDGAPKDNVVDMGWTATQIMEIEGDVTAVVFDKDGCAGGTVQISFEHFRRMMLAPLDQPGTGS